MEELKQMALERQLLEDSFSGDLDTSTDATDADDLGNDTTTTVEDVNSEDVTE